MEAHSAIVVSVSKTKAKALRALPQLHVVGAASSAEGGFAPFLLGDLFKGLGNREILISNTIYRQF